MCLLSFNLFVKYQDSQSSYQMKVISTVMKSQLQDVPPVLIVRNTWTEDILKAYNKSIGQLNPILVR